MPSPLSNRPIATRRQDVSLPRRRVHLLLAILVILAVVSGPLLVSKWFGEPSDASPEGIVSVVALPADQQPSPLDANSETLPDLLAGVVADGENPTDGIVARDALGNPAPSTESTPTPRTVSIPQQALTAPPLDPSLTRQSAHGLIPGPSSTGRTALDAYPANVPNIGQKRPIAIIIGGLGINASLTQRAIDELPAAVTLSFAPQSPNLQRWIDRARARGHEVLLEVPLEGEQADGTQHTLTVAKSADSNKDSLHHTLSRAQGYVGVTNYGGQGLLRRSDAVAPLLAEIEASGLAFFLDGSFATPNLTPLARSVSLPFAIGNGILDPSADPVVIAANLAALGDDAKSTSNVFGVGFAFPETIDAVKGWVTTLSSEGLVLVPATAMLSR